eukprot:Rhum_TRINITY_DN11951_c0_g1::Rhum_TRINITY_DN11951_c0_g1_i1::g.48188::m.48188
MMDAATPLKNIIANSTPVSATKRGLYDVATTMRAAGQMGTRRASWTVGKLPQTLTGADSRRRRTGSVREKAAVGKGAKDELPKERREAMHAALQATDRSFDHLELRRFPRLLQTMASKERELGAEDVSAAAASASASASDADHDVLFSAALVPLIKHAEVRAVCVTRRAVHLLERLDKGVASTATAGRHTVLYTFRVSDLVTIIESKKDASAVCLDFRPLAGPNSDKRKNVLASLSDPSYLLFPFRELPEAAVKERKKAGGLASEKEEFVAVLYHRFWPLPAGRADQPKAVVFISESLPLRTADDVQRALSHVVRRDQLASTVLRSNTAAADLIHAESGDKLRIAQHMAAVKALKAEGDKKIMVSLHVQNLNRSGSAKSDLIFILTDRAIYYNDRDLMERIIRRVELQDVTGILLEDNSKRADENKQWDVLLRIDLANDKSKDFSSDILFRCEMKRQRELLVRSIQSAYEDLVIDKLPVESGTNIKWGKRGKMEAWLSALRGGQRKQLLDKRTEESLRWLIYLFKHHLYSFVTILADAVPREDVHFVGISIISLCETGGLTEKLLSEVVSVEMDNSTDTTTIFRGNTLSSAILRAYVGHSVDEYLKLVLLVPLQRFVEKNPSIEVGAGCADKKELQRNTLVLWEWCDRFYDRITDPAVAESMPHEMRRVVSVISQACVKRGIDPSPYIGGYLMLRVFCPAISTPHSHNLLTEQQSNKAQRKLVLIARILMHLANKTGVQEAREPFLSHAINWWLRARSGSDREVAVPPEYRYKGGGVGGTGERVCWTAYVRRIVGDEGTQAPARDEAEDAAPPSFQETEELVKRADFASGWEDTRVLAGLHRVLMKYTEQLLCLLWTETGVRKARLGEAEAEYAALIAEDEESQEPDSDMDGDGGDCDGGGGGGG